MKKQPKVTIINDEKEPIAVEILADSIVKVAKAAQDLLSSRLNENTICLLISSKTGLAQWKIKDVLRSAADLEKDFLKSKKDPKTVKK